MRIGKLLSILAMALGLFILVPVHAEAGPRMNVTDESWLQINYAAQLYLQYRDTGSGPDKDESTTDIFFRRNRLMFVGQINEKNNFYFSIQQQGDKRIFDIEVSDIPGKDFDVLDAYYNADLTGAFRVRAGLFKNQLVREVNEGCFDPLSLDRSLFAYTPLPRLSRDFGIAAWGNLFNSKLQYRLAAMKGNDSGDDPKSSLRYTGRVHLSLLDPEDALAYSGTYLGTKKVLTVGAGYEFEPDAVFANLAGKTLAKDYQGYTYDIFFEYPTSAGTFTASAAYLKVDFDDAYLGADPDPRSVGQQGQKNGWYTKAGYLLPNKVGPGQLQVFGRYEKWNYAELSDIFDQELTWYSAGLNYLVKGQNLRYTVEFARTDFDKEVPPVKSFSTITAMLQFRF